MPTTYTVLDEFDARPIRVFVDRAKAVAYAAGRKIITHRVTRKKAYEQLCSRTDAALF